MKEKQAFYNTNNTVSNYFHSKIDFLLREKTKSGEAHVAPSPLPPLIVTRSPTPLQEVATLL